MVSLLKFVFLLIVFFVISTRSIYPTTVAQTIDPADNAALHYWHAFQFFSRFQSKETELDVYELIQQAYEERFDAATMQLFEAAEVFLNYVKTGTEQPYCEWGNLSFQDLWPGYSMRLSYCKTTTQLMIARSRYRFHLDQEEAALQDLMITFEFVDDIGSGYFIMGELEELSRKEMVLEQVLEVLPNLRTELTLKLETFFSRNTQLDRTLPGDVFFNDFSFFLSHLRNQLISSGNRFEELDASLQTNFQSILEATGINASEDLDQQLDSAESQLGDLKRKLNETPPDDLNRVLSEAGYQTDSWVIESAIRLAKYSQEIANKEKLIFMTMKSQVNDVKKTDNEEDRFQDQE